MFPTGSRYHDAERRTFVDGDGNATVYIERRFLPREPASTMITEVAVNPLDRPDLLAARALHRPEAFWRICDDNLVMSPFELTATPGHRVRVLLADFTR